MNDVVIVGAGIAGLFTALNLSKDLEITLICKKSLEENNSYLAQGGISCLKDEDDFSSYFNDIMKAGHFENNKEAVKILLNNSQEIIKDLVSLGVEFDKKNGKFDLTKEGGHSVSRILHYQDETGKEIIRKLLYAVSKKKNVKLLPYTTMIDLIIDDEKANGVLAREITGKQIYINAKNTVLATGGIGGLYENTTNFRQMTADAIAISLAKGITVKDIDYVQIHPTAFYEKTSERKFLITESIRGEGAYLLNKKGERFADELLPRDKLTGKMNKQIKIDERPFVMLDASHLDKDMLKQHFYNIYTHLLEKGYDITKESIPVTPAQHYFMGGIKVDIHGKTSMENLYAVGETACTGVHGKNRLASNSLLEGLIFAKKCAKEINKKEAYGFTD
ncbi:MAG: L-aspartate oxidase [Clostridiales Family XIII bacterium]|jgi:L-aspartate oxidase|nr:L-aspartate oxidase [Clostridiales Family XIII bacterium]